MEEKSYEVYDPYTGTVHYTLKDPDKALLLACANFIYRDRGK